MPQMSPFNWIFLLLLFLSILFILITKLFNNIDSNLYNSSNLNVSSSLSKNPKFISWTW
uniref:ATP synthase complex subunit 8 n=1 Tax=Yuukianura szeptyckii TaxID=1453868 RepID=A0A7T0M4I9_9HEXA|nr:ATP synthase F0 subunit 8 [Yuukianura szeptyckii]QPL15823.1 ATP synthase F0 subunit 8 [Yuukianura szeptyckii]